ncbi:hypothetical protein [Xanthomonas translucens]|uniref:hypothetical protein n=1 Tax=Xanthomonas campestris pv. translucens TaxID=343 RepID=UPI001F603C79|nr:hypothetical protein [Xanthomonas translucens]UNU11934.1 hypothetical protein KBV71_03790 [Xanthomonas translucens pv. translucens]
MVGRCGTLGPRPRACGLLARRGAAAAAAAAGGDPLQRQVGAGRQLPVAQQALERQPVHHGPGQA